MTGHVRYSAAPGAAVGLLCLAAIFGVFAAVEDSGPGRLLLGAAALGCAVEGLRCALVRPVVAADAGGVVVVPGLRPVEIPWSEVERIGDRLDRRRGATARSLEIDVGSTVHVIPAYRLGAPIAEVVSALEAARPPG